MQTRSSRLLRCSKARAEVAQDQDFKFTCDECGSMGIKSFDVEHADQTTLIFCAKCGCPRGTLAALQKFARFGSSVELELVTAIGAAR
jgi:transcription elongation factor Elf1